MKLVRILVGGRSVYGVLTGDFVEVLKGDPFDGIRYYGERVHVEEVKFLPPVSPSKIIGVGLNYRDHAEEVGAEVSKEPVIFLKPPSAVIGPDEPIILPPESQRVDYEGELALVVGKPCKNVSLNQAREHILGYCCFNDVTARDLQMRDGQWTRAKGFDTFAPIGPWIVTDIDPSDLKIETLVNGQIKQSSRTSSMVFSPFELLWFVSRIMTLMPGDVIATGTPSGIGPLKEGDVVEVRIEGIGTLRNPVKAYGSP